MGLDLTPELFETARQRARGRAVSIEWVEGDAESSPFRTRASSVCSQPSACSSRPVTSSWRPSWQRVCRPGGRIGLVNWTPEGQIGELFRILGGYLPAPPDYASPPPLWGSEEHVRELFAGTGVELEFARGHNPWRFAPPSSTSRSSRRATAHPQGPRAPDRRGALAGCRAELLAMAERRNEASDGTSR